ncbi:MAG: transcriptional regulator [Promethearchaeota archaeon]
MLSFPCETAVWRTLPAIRSALARALIARNMSQRQIAELLATTEATISHYRKGKRGVAVDLKPDILKAIEQLADQLVTQSVPIEKLRERICVLCNKATETAVVC